jgi:2,4-diketo-3-deoxy-L-fuconate hydrolase
VFGAWDSLVEDLEHALQGEAECVELSAVRLGPPVPNPGSIFAIGLNYPAHANGMLGTTTSNAIPTLFIKHVGSVSGPTDPILKPYETHALDYEIELAVVIGRGGRRIPRARAGEHIAGYVLANDVSARDVSLGPGIEFPMQLQIARGKGYPTFCPIGPWILTKDQVADSSDLRLNLSVNGDVRQIGSTRDMTVDVHGLIESVSSTMELRPGDLILTGTPSGCGFQYDPPRYLNEGDEVRASITGLGEMRLTVQNEPAATPGAGALSNGDN